VTDDALTIGGQDISAAKLRTRMTVAVRVNGHGPYRFVVDSGADSSVVGQRIARDLHLPPGTPAILNGTTEVRSVERVLVDALGVGSIVVRNLELPALLESDLGADGLLGLDVLVEQRLMMDFEQRTIRIEDARRRPEMVDGEIVVTARRRRGQLILTEVTAGGRAVQAVIDTGAEITIGNLALRDKLLRRNRDKFVTVGATGVTGVTTNLQLAIVDELRVGRITLRNVPIAFADVPPFRLFGLADRPALLLGTDILETFRRVSLDFRRRKIRFQLRSCGSSGVVINTAPSSRVRLSSDASGIACQR
jgi:predicted aspartyl protease